MMLISEELRVMLVEQISTEKYNAGVYMFVSGILQNKGLDNLAKIFMSQHDEEIEHSKMIYKFLTDMNAKINILSVKEVENIGYESIIELANLYLYLEKRTTEELEDIKELILEEKNGVAEEFIRDMIKIQRHELEEALTFLDNAKLCDNDWKFVKIWNDNLEVG
jgi:ferritin